MPSLRRQNASRQLQQLLTELRFARSARSVATGGLVALAARGLGVEPSARRAAGLAAGAATWRAEALADRVEREVRAGQDGARVSARLGNQIPPLGAWVIEADFAELLTIELQKRPALVVELGSGASTLVVAQQLEALGSGRLVSVEHHEDYAAATQDSLDRTGLGGRVELVHAPLLEQRIGGQTSEWYDLAKIRAAIADDPIDLLVVDGPPSTSRRARWPAVPALGERLQNGGVILLDDGRAKSEGAIARRWTIDQPDLELYWHDTVKGTWKLVRGPGGEPTSTRFARRAVTALSPRPSGLGRWPVRRA